jgi:hypothetical protein
MTLLPGALISVEQVELMRRDNVLGDGVGTPASPGVSGDRDRRSVAGASALIRPIPPRYRTARLK